LQGKYLGVFATALFKAPVTVFLFVGLCARGRLQTASLDQYDRLVVVTLAPLFTLVVIWVVHAGLPIAVSFRRRALGPADRAGIVAKYRLFLYRTVLVMLFTIYPGLSTEIVKTFRWGRPPIPSRPVPSRPVPSRPSLSPTPSSCFLSCLFPPLPSLSQYHVCVRCLKLELLRSDFPFPIPAPRCDSFDHGLVVLAADYRINCHSARYRSMVFVAIVMLCVFPVGVPVALGWALWRKRRQLYPRNEGLTLRVAPSPDGVQPSTVVVDKELLSPADLRILHGKVCASGSADLVGTLHEPLAHAGVLHRSPPPPPPTHTRFPWPHAYR
jgi:hypothetical protein